MERNVCICVFFVSIDILGIIESAEGVMFVGVGCFIFFKIVMVFNFVGFFGRYFKKIINYGRYVDLKEGLDKVCWFWVFKFGGMENF